MLLVFANNAQKVYYVFEILFFNKKTKVTFIEIFTDCKVYNIIVVITVLTFTKKLYLLLSNILSKILMR